MRSPYDANGSVRIVFAYLCVMGKCSFESIRLGSKMSGTVSGCQWMSVYRTNKHAAFCRVCERVILLPTMGIKTVDSHGKSTERALRRATRKLIR